MQGGVVYITLDLADFLRGLKTSNSGSFFSSVDESGSTGAAVLFVTNQATASKKNRRLVWNWNWNSMLVTKMLHYISKTFIKQNHRCLLICINYLAVSRGVKWIKCLHLFIKISVDQFFVRRKILYKTYKNVLRYQNACVGTGKVLLLSSTLAHA